MKFSFFGVNLINIFHPIHTAPLKLSSSPPKAIWHQQHMLQERGFLHNEWERAEKNVLTEFLSTFKAISLDCITTFFMKQSIVKRELEKFNKSSSRNDLSLIIDVFSVSVFTWIIQYQQKKINSILFMNMMRREIFFWDCIPVPFSSHHMAMSMNN